LNFQTKNDGGWYRKGEKSSVSEGIFKLTTKREMHLRTFWDGCNKTKVPKYRLFYTSGVAKSRATGSYGYYEACIKGADKFPRVSPAFWMYSKIDRTLTNEGDVQYTKIGVVKLTQKQTLQELDHDLHNIVIKDGILKELNLTLYKGLRTPHTKGKCNQFYPLDNQSAQGFPTLVKIDYVRAWLKQ